jgi:hypothetical protein
MPSTRRLFVSEHERAVFRLLAQLALVNPFLTERIDLEREILGPAFVDPGRFMSPGPDARVTHRNIALITELVGRMLPSVRKRYAAGAEAGDGERRIYVIACLYYLYDSYDTRFRDLIDEGTLEAPFYEAFLADYQQCFGFLPPPAEYPGPVRVFEVLFQIRRAFHFLYLDMRGGSLPVARLRAQIWDAIFGGALDEYGLHGWNRMARISTLIQGPSGTGKELCANAIGRSGYVPFDPGTMRFAPHGDYYAALNLLAFAPGLLESELFGHRKGAFTGADRDKKGLVETVSPFGAVLLDEVAEIKPRMQVKLLRLLQERSFRRVGDEGDERALHPRILTATHRDPAERMAEGLLREDFFRRICMLKIVTPSLRERLDDSPGELRELVSFLAADMFGSQGAGRVTDEVEAWVAKHLPHHPWTGNMRELLQCVVEVKTFHTYSPERPDPAVALALDLRAVKAPLAEINRRYAELALTRAGSPGEAARLLGIDVRTLQAMLGLEPAPRGRPRGRGAKRS